jgi:predicted AAA+ superfamily ATPase
VNGYPEDLGILWEHLVLNELYAHTQRRGVMFWRTKRGDELDFVLPAAGVSPVAIECKRKAADFDPKALRAFRELHPGGRNFVVATDVPRSYERRYGEITVRFVDLPTLIDSVVPARSAPKKGGNRPARRGKRKRDP